MATGRRVGYGVAWATLALVSALSGLTPSSPLGLGDARSSTHGGGGPSRRSGGEMWKDRRARRSLPAEAEASADSALDPILGTLAHLHTGEHLVLAAHEPSDPRFTAFLADRVTSSSRAIDPRLLGLVRRLAIGYPGARFEVVSGYRSEKLNEGRRKKGRHVASHSQHSLGQALDFRVVPRGATHGVDPRRLESEVRALGWDGGVGVYTLASDWFVHADVGPNRRWQN